MENSGLINYYNNLLKKVEEIRPIDGITNLSDEEIIEKLHEISNPIFELIPEIKRKLRDYMPKDDKEEYKMLLNSATSYMPIDNETLEELKLGYWEDEDMEEDEEPFEIEFGDIFVSFGVFISVYFFKGLKEIDEVLEKRKIINNVKINYYRIFWSFWGIDENLVKILDYADEKRERTKGGLSKAEQNIWESYEKTYFYSRENIKRACDIFLKFNKQATARINGKDYPKNLSKEDLYDCGFVYFIRNKDIYKIGITQNMLQRMEQLKPDELLDSVRCSNYKELERKIHSEFKGCRIPQTEYFRLNKKEISRIHEILKDKAK